MKNQLLLISILTTLVSCSHSIRVKTPVHKLLSAESQGKIFAGRANIYALNGSEAELDLENGQTDNDLEIDGGRSDAFAIGSSLELGLHGPIDAVYISGGSIGTSVYGAKIQLLGQNKKIASDGSVSISVIAGYGEEEQSAAEGQDLELVPLDDDTSVDLLIANQTTGVITTYRHTKNLLVNVGYYISQHNFRGALESENTELDGDTVNYHGTTHLITLGFESYIKNDLIFMGAEIANEVVKWDHTEAFNQAHATVNVGFSW